jgi:hypothetical protein
MTTHWFRAQVFPFAQPFQAPEVVQPVENPATAFDRAYIAEQELLTDVKGEMCTYDRAPVAGEWAETMADDAFVRVFVINEFTTVRVLYNQAGDRVAEPMIDSFRPDTTYVLTS